MQAAHHTCKNCHNNFKGNYCNYCGEKIFSGHDKSVGHVLHEVFHFITHFEGKFLTTTKTILRKPGKFSLDYCDGIQKKYFKPVSLFLLLVILYLLFPKVQGLNMKFQTYVSEEYNYRWFAVPIIKKKMQSSGYPVDALAKKYDARSPNIAKLMLLMNIPLSALLLWLLFLKRQKPFYDHFIIATEYNSFLLMVTLAVFPIIGLIWLLFYWMSGIKIDFGENYMGYVFGIVLIVFSYTAFKRFYRQKVFITLLKTILFVGVYFTGIHLLYNILLLMTVLLFV